MRSRDKKKQPKGKEKEKVQSKEPELVPLELSAITNPEGSLVSPVQKLIVGLPHIFYSINDLALMFKLSRPFISYLVNRKGVDHCAVGKRKLFTPGQVLTLAGKIEKNEFRAGIERES